MKTLKIIYMIFWSICMFTVDVSIVISKIKFHQKILYIILIQIAYIVVVSLFKGENEVRKK
jgi:hypothetical protein